MTHGMGRIFSLDHRDARHLLRSVVPVTRPKRKTWRLDARLDQGAAPFCVGFAWQGFLAAAPYRQKGLDGPTIYHGAQQHDDEPGEGYDGTSVRGGADYLKDDAKKIKSYRWAFSAEDALNACGSEGPLVLGSDWKSGMDEPNRDGLIRFSGGNRGGHAYLMVGYNDSRELATIQNSWGRSWGKGGRAYLPYPDLEQALREAGEACMAIER